jgi:tetratricopeptide (TPR) repeat protein
MTPFPPPARALAAICLLLGHLGMFLTSFSVIKNTFEERFRPKTSLTAANSFAPAGSPTAGKAGFAAPPDSSEGSGTLTGEIRSDLQDAEAIMGLGEELMAAGEWARAEVLLERAIRDRPLDKRSRHLLGVCLFRQNKIPEAAKVFEDMTRAQEDPIALYNLAILYKHHLNLPERAEGLLRRALDSPDIDEDLGLRLREELGAAPEGR